MVLIDRAKDQYHLMSSRLITMLVAKGRVTEAREQNKLEKEAIKRVEQCLHQFESHPNYVATIPPPSPMVRSPAGVYNPEESILNRESDQAFNCGLIPDHVPTGSLNFNDRVNLSLLDQNAESPKFDMSLPNDHGLLYAKFQPSVTPLA